MDTLSSYVSERISEIEKILERDNCTDLQKVRLLGKYRAFVEIEEFLAGGFEDDCGGGE